MTLVELCFALSIFGSAIAGGVAGWDDGWLAFILGIASGPFIGAAVYLVIVFPMIWLFGLTCPKSKEDPGNLIQKTIGITLVAAMLISPPASWYLTSFVVNRLFA